MLSQKEPFVGNTALVINITELILATEDSLLPKKAISIVSSISRITRRVALSIDTGLGLKSVVLSHKLSHSRAIN